MIEVKKETKEIDKHTKKKENWQNKNLRKFVKIRN